MSELHSLTNRNTTIDDLRENYSNDSNNGSNSAIGDSSNTTTNSSNSAAETRSNSNPIIDTNSKNDRGSEISDNNSSSNTNIVHQTTVNKDRKVSLSKLNFSQDELTNKVRESALKKREFVVQEIISTEHTYVTNLQLLIEMFVIPLSNGIIDQNDVQFQFGTLETICELHEKLYEKILIEKTNGTLDIAQLFCDFSENFTNYSTYLVNFEPAMQRRGSILTSNRKYADFVDKTVKDPRCAGIQSIESLLILPVQRIPRYRLLFEQLLKYTPEDHKDIKTIKEALDRINSIAMSNNEAIRKRENREKIMAIMMTIESMYRVDLLEDKNRSYIKNGMLLRQCR